MSSLSTTEKQTKQDFNLFSGPFTADYALPLAWLEGYKKFPLSKSSLSFKMSRMRKVFSAGTQRFTYEFVNKKLSESYFPIPQQVKIIPALTGEAKVLLKN